MQATYPILMLLLFLTWHAQAQSWEGQFSGNIQGTQSSLNLETRGDVLNGVIDAQGYKYNLSGTVQATSASGKLTDPQTQAVMDFEAQRTPDGVVITLISMDPYTGQQQRTDFTFYQAGSTANAGTQGAADNAAVERDQRLVGLWSYSESYTSGEYSFASQWKMQINPDGTYLYGDGRVVGGGGGASGDSGSGDVSRGQWKTQGNIIYINEGYQWQPYCKYYVEGYSMMLTFGDGSKQVWKRIQ